MDNTASDTLRGNKIVCPLTIIECSTPEIEQIFESGRRVRELGPQDGSFISHGLCDWRESRWNPDQESTPVTVTETK